MFQNQKNRNYEKSGMVSPAGIEIYKRLVEENKRLRENFQLREREDDYIRRLLEENHRLRYREKKQIRQLADLGQRLEASEKRIKEKEKQEANLAIQLLRFMAEQCIEGRPVAQPGKLVIPESEAALRRRKQRIAARDALEGKQLIMTQ